MRAVIFLLFLQSSAVLAGVPDELTAIFPVGQKIVQLSGYTDQDEPCSVEVSNTGSEFYLSLIPYEDVNTSWESISFVIDQKFALQLLDSKPEILSVVSGFFNEQNNNYNIGAERLVMSLGRRPSGDLTYVSVATYAYQLKMEGYVLQKMETCNF